MIKLLKLLPLLCLLFGACDGGNAGTGTTLTDSIAPREATDPVPEPPVRTDSAQAADQKPTPDTGSGTKQEEKLYRISGTEPFWSLTLGRPYSIFRSMEGDSIGFAYQAPKTASGRQQEWAQLFLLGSGNWVLLRRAKSPCSDGMSDREWEYTATLWLRGSLFDGCGEKLKPETQK